MTAGNGSFASSDPFQLLFELSESPAAICDLNLALLACNPPFERLCGHQPLGRRLDAALDLAPLTAPRSGHSAETTARTRSGEVVRLVLSGIGEAVAVAVRSGSAASARNGHEAPPQSALLKITRQLLGAQSEEGAAMKELERRMIQAEKLASLGQFAASVVHEINNPLTAIVSYADALLSRWTATPGCSAADQDKLRKILNSSDRILRFTRQLVSYARPVQDKLEEVELSALLDTSASFCDHILSHHGITVEKDYAELPKLTAVKGKLAQVFINLITNACQAMQPGGNVYLSTRLEGNIAVVRIRDTGPGIESENLAKVFEPFYTTKPDGKGTGLGLSIVRAIVESHGGTIEAQSPVGGGTTFVVRLPTIRYAENIAPSLTVNNPSRDSVPC